VRLVHMLVASQTLTGFAIVGRLATLDGCNEAETGSILAAHVFAFRSFDRQIAPPPAQLATCRTSNSHGELLSVHENSQTSPGAPTDIASAGCR